MFTINLLMLLLKLNFHNFTQIMKIYPYINYTYLEPKYKGCRPSIYILFFYLIIIFHIFIYSTVIIVIVVVTITIVTVTVTVVIATIIAIIPIFTINHHQCIIV